MSRDLALSPGATMSELVEALAEATGQDWRMVLDRGGRSVGWFLRAELGGDRLVVTHPVDGLLAHDVPVAERPAWVVVGIVGDRSFEIEVGLVELLHGLDAATRVLTARRPVSAVSSS